MAFFWPCVCDLGLPDFRLLVTEHKLCCKLREESFDSFIWDFVFGSHWVASLHSSHHPHSTVLWPRERETRYFYPAKERGWPLDCPLVINKGLIPQRIFCGHSECM